MRNLWLARKFLNPIQASSENICYELEKVEIKEYVLSEYVTLNPTKFHEQLSEMIQLKEKNNYFLDYIFEQKKLLLININS